MTNPITPSALTCAKNLVESLKLKVPYQNLARVIEIETGLVYLVHGCQEALKMASESNREELSLLLRGALLWAGMKA